MNRVELEATRNALMSSLQKLPQAKCCTCEHFKIQNSICDLYDETPPQAVQETGCEVWVWDGVPF